MIERADWMSEEGYASAVRAEQLGNGTSPVHPKSQVRLLPSLAQIRWLLLGVVAMGLIVLAFAGIGHLLPVVMRKGFDVPVDWHVAWRLMALASHGFVSLLYAILAVASLCLMVCMGVGLLIGLGWLVEEAVKALLPKPAVRQ